MAIESMEKSVCKKFCSFYKPEKETSKCGTYLFLERNLSAGEIRKITALVPSSFDRSADGEIKALVCDRCEFEADGCDFRGGLDSPPCGGYAIIEHLLKGDLLCPVR